MTRQPDQDDRPRDDIEVSVVMPCLNEARTLSRCIAKAQRDMAQSGLRGEVIVADNGSTDASPAIARETGARVVTIQAKGYGSALMGGIAAARGTYVIMGDADDSYDFEQVPAFVSKLREGFDLVMGNRFAGGIAHGAMKPLHKYLGNPVLTGIGRLLFHAPCGDFHCGLRGFRRDAILRLDLRTTGMEFASEMVVKATLFRLRIAEVPTTLSKDGRGRPPHLRSWRDGWRHLRFLLLYSPRWLFLYPGMALMVLGAATGAWLLPGPQRVAGVTFDVHTMLYAALAVLVGFQSVSFAVFTKLFAVTEGLLPQSPAMTRLLRHVTLEKGLIAGGAMSAIGIAATVYAFWTWQSVDFGDLTPARTLRAVIPAILALALGSQVILSSFFLSVLRLRRK